MLTKVANMKETGAGGYLCCCGTIMVKCVGGRHLIYMQIGNARGAGNRVAKGRGAQREMGGGDQQ